MSNKLTLRAVSVDTFIIDYLYVYGNSRFGDAMKLGVG